LDTADHTLDTTDHSIDSRTTDRPGRRNASVNRATGDMECFPHEVHPCPDPAETLTLLVAELHRRTDHPDSDMTRLALQTWAEALRDPVLHHRARELYGDALEHIGELAQRWRDNGHLPADADTDPVAATVLSIMFGLIVMHHVVDDVPADVLRTGVALLGAATRTPAPTSTSAKQTTP
jgi:hypothetical protein